MQLSSSKLILFFQTAKISIIQLLKIQQYNEINKYHNYDFFAVQIQIQQHTKGHLISKGLFGVII